MPQLYSIPNIDTRALTLSPHSLSSSYLWPPPLPLLLLLLLLPLRLEYCSAAGCSAAGSYG
jgi:hypothetical protein